MHAHLGDGQHDQCHRDGGGIDDMRLRQEKGRDRQDDGKTQPQIGVAYPVTAILQRLIAGRMVDADPIAHGAIRVMVNMYQTGEAAGVASVLAMRSTGDVRTIDVPTLCKELAAGGSIVI